MLHCSRLAAVIGLITGAGLTTSCAGRMGFEEEPLATEAFVITGVTGNLDGVVDEWLGTTVNPVVHWRPVEGAADYGVAIRDAEDTEDICPAEHTMATSHSFSSCRLTDGATYSVKLNVYSESRAASPAANDGFQFIVDNSPPATPVFTAPTTDRATFASDYLVIWYSSDAGSGLKAMGTYGVERFGSADCSGSPLFQDNLSGGSLGLIDMVPATTYSVRVVARDEVGNVSAAACSPNVACSPVPALLLTDSETGSTTIATHYEVDVVVSNDQGARKWCLSEIQETQPISGTAACAGGAGSANGWFASRPLSMTLSAGDGPKPVHLWLADAAGEVNPNTTAQTISLLSTPGPLSFDADPKKISSLNRAALTVTGRCTEPGGSVTISGAGTASTTCAAGGTWEASVDFTGAADGVVTVYGVQCQASGALCSFPVARDFTKDTAFCDDATNSGAAPFAAGTGTPDDPYLGCNDDQLRQLSAHPSASFRLRNDIDAGGATWSPIANFSGTLDGNGFAIKNLSFDTGGWPTGLFARLSGTVHNLGVVDIHMVGFCHMGAIAGILEVGGVIHHSYATGLLQGYADYIGGLVGQNEGFISASYSTVRVENILPVVQHFCVGGLVGGNYSTGVVSSSYSAGDVIALTTDRIGGFMGCNAGLIIDSYATGAVVDDTTSTNFGGLVGTNTGTVQNSYSIGEVRCESCTSGIGGLIGTDSGTVNASYWDTETSGFPTSAAGSGLTTAEMQMRASYVGWDFVSTWVFDSAQSCYPVLDWQ